MEPVSFVMQVVFVAVVYLFLLWVARSALKDLRGTTRAQQVAPQGGGGEATSLHALSGSPNGGSADARLVVDRAPGHEPGMEYDIGEGAVLGRGDQAEIRLEDPFASSRHARLVRQGGVVVLEDMGSTNGTYLNEELLTGPAPLHTGDRVRIGDSEFTYVA